MSKPESSQSCRCPASLQVWSRKALPYYYSVEVKQFRSIMDETQTSGDEDFFTGCSPVHQNRSEAEPSCVSIKSDASMDPPIKFKSGDTWPDLSPVQQNTSEPEFSCVTMNSDKSMVCHKQFKSGDTWPGLSSEVLTLFRSNLMKKFEHLYEGTVMQGNPTLLNEIYTELYITDNGTSDMGVLPDRFAVTHPQQLEIQDILLTMC
ncbi:hypothetical protein QQF64_035801 [Cirrhinus molitorella]|uniref:FISNA domain-containing protein n=1 Tax=Cirrhinus molitorella TaxID=172907 RepID=A0ABR3NGR9_9TELE